MFANTAGNLCEGTGSNVFYVADGELRTPTLASGCLAGVTRALVLEWCGGVEVDAPLAEVARQTGFANAYHLSRRFSLTYQTPPGAYRRDGSGDPYAPLDAAGLRDLARALST